MPNVGQRLRQRRHQLAAVPVTLLRRSHAHFLKQEVVFGARALLVTKREAQQVLTILVQAETKGTRGGQEVPEASPSVVATP